MVLTGWIFKNMFNLKSGYFSSKNYKNNKHPLTFYLDLKSICPVDYSRNLQSLEGSEKLLLP